MLKGYDDNGNLINVRLTADGKVKVDGGSGGYTPENPCPVNVENSNSNPIPVTGSVTVENTSQNAIPVSVQNANNSETTLIANFTTIGTTASSISINKKVKEISIANYSETATLTLTIGNSNFVIGSNICCDLPINDTLTSISLVSDEADTKVQYIIKGEV